VTENEHRTREVWDPFAPSVGLAGGGRTGLGVGPSPGRRMPKCPARVKQFLRPCCGLSCSPARSGRVVEDQAERVAAARAHDTDAVPHIRAVAAPCPHGCGTAGRPRKQRSRRRTREARGWRRSVHTAAPGAMPRLTSSRSIRGAPRVRRPIEAHSRSAYEGQDRPKRARRPSVPGRGTRKRRAPATSRASAPVPGKR